MLTGNVGSRVKAVRTSLRMTQATLSSALEIDRGHLSNIERNHYNPSLSLLKLISLMYSISYNWLKTGNGEMVNDIVIPQLLSIKPQQKLSDKQHIYMSDTKAAYKAAEEAEDMFLSAVKLTPAQNDLYRSSLARAAEAQHALDYTLDSGVHIYTLAKHINGKEAV